jgi:phosphoribosylglycinamide formyltransferase-1
VALLSGEGKQLQSIFSQLDSGALEGEVVAVLSDNADAGGLSAARERGIETVVLDSAAVGDADVFSEEINANLDRLNPGVVVLDGFTASAKLEERRDRHVVHSADALLEIAATD